MADLEGKTKDQELPEFDPDYDPSNPINVNAAKARHLAYDHLSQTYIDGDGCSILDRYGQPY